MPLFRSRNTKMLDALTGGMRLLLPADPGQVRMLDAVRQFDPAARQEGIRTYVDGSTIYLGKAFEIEPEIGRKAGLPPDITIAYFMNWVDRGAARAGEVFTQKYQEREKVIHKETRSRGSYVLGGLAARFGGLSVPSPPELGEPLHVSVYTPHRASDDDLAKLVDRHAPGLRPGAAGEAGHQVTAVYRGSGPFQIESWSPGGVSFHLMDEQTKGSRVMGTHAGGVPAQGLLVVRAAQPAAGADPAAARAVGEVALGLAADTGGICLDVFGFRVRQPEDLVIR